MPEMFTTDAGRKRPGRSRQAPNSLAHGSVAASSISSSHGKAECLMMR